MRQFILAASAIAVVASAGFALSSTPARAQAASLPVCLTDGDAGGLRCDFPTLAACNEALKGMGGSCIPNGAAAIMTTKMGPKGLPFDHTFRAKK